MNRLFKKFTSVALISACAATCVLGISACTGQTYANEAPSDTDIAKLEAPTDGSLPTDHTAEENLVYLAYTLDSQTQYHCYTYTETRASIATQYTKSYKDYRNGVMISSDITFSALVKSGTQACFVDIPDGTQVYMRYSSTPNSDTTNLTAEWSTDEPDCFDEQSYLTTYGLLQTEMTNYIINDLTITDSTAATDNGDGTYTQSVVLDPVASTYYYQYGMKTRGGLDDYPEFEQVDITFTFDSSWRVLKIEVNEVAKVKKIFSVTSTTHSTAEYSYSVSDFDEAHFDYYDSYFKQYIGSDAAAAVAVTGALSDGLSCAAAAVHQPEAGFVSVNKNYADCVSLVPARKM